MALKEKLINRMMENQFSNMSTEEKQQMMDTMMEKFFAGMTDEEKKQMMSTMMPKMMGNMMGGQGQNPMMGMMNKKGKDQKMPWDMCREMVAGFQETASNAKFATPELRGLFCEWCEQVETEILEFVKKQERISVKDLSEAFKLSAESIQYLLSRLASRGMINYQLEQEEPAGKEN